ncbi:MAG: hypothetical protein AAF492_24675 [Verrucomicrobiota bacterium]
MYRTTIVLLFTACLILNGAHAEDKEAETKPVASEEKEEAEEKKEEEKKPSPADRIEVLFGVLDLDKNGKLSIEESIKGNAQKAVKSIRRFDKDGDGSISRAEHKAHAAFQKVDFDRIDQDGNGQLSVGEIVTFDSVKFRKAFAKSDLDGDQTLSKEEFVASWSVRLKKPEPEAKDE